jgi:hypothetical protein
MARQVQLTRDQAGLVRALGAQRLAPAVGDVLGGVANEARNRQAAPLALI